MPDKLEKYLKVYETPYGNVHINVGAPYLPIALSCGFDSAVMLYMLAETVSKLNPQAKIIPMTVRRINPLPEKLPELDRVDNFPIANRVVDFVKAHFFKVNFEKHLRMDAPYWWVKTDDHQSTYVHSQKTLLQYVSWITNYDFPEGHPTLPYVRIFYNGVTKNPPISLEGHHHRELHRDTNIDNNCDDEKSATVYIDSGSMLTLEPFRNADKRITMWLANELGILPSLLKISRSCEGGKEETDEWTKECNTCWWCLERQWAYDTYKQPEMKFDEKESK